MNGYYLSKATAEEYNISNTDTGEILIFENKVDLKKFTDCHKVFGIGYIDGTMQLDCKSEAMDALDNINYMVHILFKLSPMDCGRKFLYLGRHRGCYLFKEDNKDEVVCMNSAYLVENQSASVEILEPDQKVKVPFQRYSLQKVPEKYKLSCKWSEFEFYKLAGQVRGSRVTVRYTGRQRIKCLNCDKVIRYDEFVELPFTRVNDAKRWITWEIKRE